MKIQSKDCEKIFANHHTDRGSAWRYKNPLQLDSKKTDNPMKNEQRIWIYISLERYISDQQLHEEILTLLINT